MEDRKPISITTILMWILGGLWAITFFMTTTSYTEIKEDVKENTSLTTSHAATIDSLESTTNRIELKLDRLIDNLLLTK